MLSNKNLLVFFEQNRAQKEDVAIIVYYLLRALLSNEINIYFSMEKVFYDSEAKKIILIENSTGNKNKDEEIRRLIKMICEECRYAEDGVYDFSCEIYRLVCEKNYIQCMKELESYIDSKQKKKYRRCGIYVIHAICIIIIVFFEIFLLKTG